MGHNFHCSNCKQYQWVVTKAHFDVGYYPITCLYCGCSGTYRLDIVRRFYNCSHERFDHLHINLQRDNKEGRDNKEDRDNREDRDNSEDRDAEDNREDIKDRIMTCTSCHLNVIHQNQFKTVDTE